LRSTTEIAFRIRQELTNVVLLLRPPSFGSTPSAANLPDVPGVTAVLRDTKYAQEVCRIAEQIRDRRARGSS
jgi:hypothetical protein